MNSANDAPLWAVVEFGVSALESESARARQTGVSPVGGGARSDGRAMRSNEPENFPTAHDWRGRGTRSVAGRGRGSAGPWLGLTVASPGEDAPGARSREDSGVQALERRPEEESEGHRRVEPTRLGCHGDEPQELVSHVLAMAGSQGSGAGDPA